MKGMWIASLLPSLPRPLWPRVVASDMGKLDINNVLMLTELSEKEVFLHIKMNLALNNAQ